MAKESIFSERALKKISTPEELDQLMHVTSPQGWVALVAFIMLVISGIFWCMNGKIPITAHGSGILMRSRGITEAVCMGEGQVEEVCFQLGQEVKKGQVLVKISQPLLENRMKVKKEQIEGLASLKRPSPEDIRLLVELRISVDDLARDMEIKSFVRSPSSGVIIQKLVGIGEYVTTGQTVADIEIPSEELIGVIFVPVDEGEDIQPGMRVDINPKIASKDEYGFMLGKVRHVSLYPQRKQSLMRFLKNEQLADMFLAQGPLLGIYVELDKKPGSTDEYRWSSSRAPKFFIQSGTLCDSTIQLKEVHPISLIFTKAR